MGYVARGLYRELLDEAWVEGFLPDDMSALAEICDCPVEVMTEQWPKIAPCWELNEHGKWINDKLDAQRTERDAIRVSKTQAGRIGGLVKTINKLESEDANPEDINRVKKAEAEARDTLAGAKQQLADARFLEAGARNDLANARPVLADASGCHIEEQEQEKSKKQKKRNPSAAKAPEAESSLHSRCHVVINRYWRKFHPGDVLAPWDGAEGKQLQRLLTANPSLTEEGFTRLLANRARSDVNHSERPVKWLPSLTDFSSGPLDRFGHPKEMANGKAGQPAGKAEQRNNQSRDSIARAAQSLGIWQAPGVDGADEGGESGAGFAGGYGDDLDARLDEIGVPIRASPIRAGAERVTSQTGPEILPRAAGDSSPIGGINAERAH